MNAVGEMFNISYENGVSSIHMVIKACVPKSFINYQYEMIANNDCKGIVKTSVRRKNEISLLYCDITSRLSLSQYLKGKKLTREEFLGIIEKIIDTISGAKGYLLHEQCFLLEKDYVYIKPGTGDVQLVYLPYEISANEAMSLQKLLIDIIMASDFAETSSDNYLQRILSNIKADTFCLSGLKGLLREISGSSTVKAEGITFNTYETPMKQTSAAADYLETENETKQKNVIDISWRIIAKAASQVLTVFLLYFIVKSSYIEDNLSKYAFCLVIAAVDIIAVMKFFNKKPGAEKHCEKAELSQMSAVRNDISSNKSEFMNIKYGTSGMSGINGINGTSVYWNDAETTEADDQSTRLLSPEMSPQSLGNRKRACLKRNKDGNYEEIMILKEYFTIGRMEGQADYICRSPAVGRVHAEIIHRDGSYYIRDINSRNGTYINNERIESNRDYNIEDNDKITFADSEFVFNIL